MPGTVLGTEGLRERGNAAPPPLDSGERSRPACQQLDWGSEKGCTKALWVHRGRVTHDTEGLQGCAIGLAIGVSLLRHSKLTASLIPLRGSRRGGMTLSDFLPHWVH